MATRSREHSQTFAANGNLDFIDIRGPQEVIITGDFGGGTLTHLPLLADLTEGAVEKTITAAESYKSEIQSSRFTLAGASDPDLRVTIIAIVAARTI